MFGAAMIIGNVIDASHKPVSFSMYIGAVLMLPVAASVLYLPMLIASGAISVRALWVESRRGLAALSVVLDIMSCVPAGWSFFLFASTRFFGLF
ncbi:hypothetical protein ACRAWC_01320 [Leifsonia sp. L25]|uniref:hypothetical protein n=1 Tax=Actinomycetes TaxID=1760 RepID=UPI003D68FC3E